MKLRQFILLIIGFSALFLSCKWKKGEVDYRTLKWSCEALDEFSFDITIEDSFIHITSYEEDTLTRQLVKKDTVSSKITYWNNGIIVIENNTNIINDTIIYEIANVDGVNGLLLNITKYEYWLSNLPPMEISVSLALKTDYPENLTATNFWPPYPEMIDGLKSGDKISWNDLEYFDSFNEYKLRRNPNISINPVQGKITYIKQRNIPFGEVPNIVNEVSEKLGFHPVEERILDELPSYTWVRGFLSVRLMQEYDYEKGSGKKESYSFTVDDAKPLAANRINPSSNESDRLQRVAKQKVKDYLIKALESNTINEALKTIDSALSIDPSCYLAHQLKAEVKFSSGNTNGAKLDCLNAFRLNEYHQPTLALLLYLYLIEGEHESAKKLVREKEQFIDADSKSAATLGDYFRVVENNIDKACKYYNLAFDRGHPNGLEALQNYCN